MWNTGFMIKVSDGTRNRLSAEQWGRWLNRDQAVEYLGLESRYALYRLVKQGLPAYRWGQSKRSGLKFDRLRLDEWAEEHRIYVAEPRRKVA
jgi:hypothetical protein